MPWPHHDYKIRGLPVSFFGNIFLYRNIESLLKKMVVWVFPKRNGKIIGWLVGIPAVTVKFP